MSESFRLRVRHNCLFVDGGYILPCKLADSPEDFSDQWIEVPNGNYRVTVYALAWYDEPDAVGENGDATENSLTSYVAVFESVETLEEIDSPPSLPRLDPSRPEVIFYPSPSSLFSTQLLEREYPILIRPEIVFPNIELNLPLTIHEYGYIQKTEAQGSYFSVIITNMPEPQSVAMLFKITSYGGSLDRNSLNKFDMTGGGSQIVKLVNIFDRDGICWAQVEPFEPPSSFADPALIEQLKQWFVQYAATDKSYQQRVSYYRFYAERVAAMTDAKDIGWAIAFALNLPPETKYNLLQANEADLIQQLYKIAN